MSAKAVTLRQLVRDRLPASLQWLAGENNADQPVQWAGTSLSELKRGDLLIVEAKRYQDDLQAEARRKGAVGILLLNYEGDRGDFSDALPIFTIPDWGDVRSAQQELLSQLIRHQAEQAEQGVRVYAQLSQLAADGEDLSGLTRAMQEISDRGVLVQDKRLRVLASAPSPELHDIWGDLLAQLGRDESLPAALQDRKRAGTQSAVLKEAIPGGLRRVIAPIVVGGIVRGYLSLIGMGSSDGLATTVAEQGALVCAVEMARTKAVRETEKRLHGDLLTALLNGNISPRDASLWTESLGIDLEQEHVALRFSWDAPAPPSRRRLETLLNGELARQKSTVIVSKVASEVICFCQVPRGQRRPEDALRLGQAVLERAYAGYPNGEARCGIGTPATDLGEWRVSFQRAGQALQLARRLSERKPLYFPDLSVYRLLMLVENKPELMDFQEEILGPVLAHESGYDFIRTLEAYFENGGNLTKTAKALFIHRNTLQYRMERIQETVRMDLNDPDARLSLSLALRIYRMMGSDEESETVQTAQSE